jgi:hypothetical protein
MLYQQRWLPLLLPMATPVAWAFPPRKVSNMPRNRLDPEFIHELGEILQSEGTAERYDRPSGKLIARLPAPFTGEWTLDSLELISGTQAVARFSAEGHQVSATISASDFKGHAGKRSRDPVRSHGPYSALAVQVSELIEEKILIHSPSELDPGGAHPPLALRQATLARSPVLGAGRDLLGRFGSPASLTARATP